MSISSSLNLAIYLFIFICYVLRETCIKNKKRERVHRTIVKASVHVASSPTTPITKRLTNFKYYYKKKKYFCSCSALFQEHLAKPRSWIAWRATRLYRASSKRTTWFILFDLYLRGMPLKVACSQARHKAIPYRENPNIRFVVSKAATRQTFEREQFCPQDST